MSTQKRVDQALERFAGDHVAAAAYVVITDNKPAKEEKHAGPKATRTKTALSTSGPRPLVMSLQSLAAQEVLKRRGFFKRQIARENRSVLAKRWEGRRDAMVALPLLHVPDFVDVLSQLDDRMIFYRWPTGKKKKPDPKDSWGRSIAVHDRFRQVVLAHAAQVSDKYNVFWHYMKSMWEDARDVGDADHLADFLAAHKLEFTDVPGEDGSRSTVLQTDMLYLNLIPWPTAPTHEEMRDRLDTEGLLTYVPFKMAYAPDEMPYRVISHVANTSTYATELFTDIRTSTIDQTLEGLALHHDMTLLFGMLFSEKLDTSRVPFNITLRFGRLGFSQPHLRPEELLLGSPNYYAKVGRPEAFDFLLRRSWNKIPVLQAMWNILLHNARTFLHFNLMWESVQADEPYGTHDADFYLKEAQTTGYTVEPDDPDDESYYVDHGDQTPATYGQWPRYDDDLPRLEEERNADLTNLQLPEIGDYLTLSVKFTDRATNTEYFYFLDPRMTLSVACQHTIRAIDAYRSVNGPLTGTDFVFEFYYDTLDSDYEPVALEPNYHRYDTSTEAAISSVISVYGNSRAEGRLIEDTLWGLWMFYHLTLPMDVFIERYKSPELGPYGEDAFRKFEMLTTPSDSRFIELARAHILEKRPYLPELDIIKRIARMDVKRRADRMQQKVNLYGSSVQFLNEPVFVNFKDIAPKRYFP